MTLNDLGFKVTFLEVECLRDKITLSLCFKCCFPNEPGLAGFIEAQDDGSGGDNWSYKTCKALVKSSLPTNQH